MQFSEFKNSKHGKECWINSNYISKIKLKNKFVTYIVIYIVNMPLKVQCLYWNKLSAKTNSSKVIFSFLSKIYLWITTENVCKNKTIDSMVFD